MSTSFEFTVSVRLADPWLSPDTLVERISASPLSDVTLGIGQRGKLGMMFTRSDETFADAACRAVKEITTVLPEAIGLSIVWDNQQ